jgi:tetratricopeptide (TPR) repeat protein
MRALYLRGSSFFKKNYLDACIQDLSTVLRSQPTHQDCLYTRGLAYFKTNKHELALKDLTRVLELNPDHVNAAYSRAACYNKMGLLTEAIEDYNFALSKDQSSNGSVTSGNTSSNLMPPSTPLFPSSSSKDDLASFGGMNSSASSITGGNNGGTDTPKSIGTMSLSSYLHKSGRVETPKTASSAGMWSAENSPSRSNIVPAGSGNKKLDAIDAAGIFSLYEEGYESSTSGTGTQRSQSRGRSRVDSNDGSYIDSAPASTIGTRRPSFSSTSTGSTLNPSSTVNGNNNGRSTTPGGGNGFSFKSLSEMKRPTNGAQQNSGNGQLQPGGQNTAPSTPMRTPIGVASAQFQGSETNGGNGFLPPPSRSRSGSIGRNNTLSNVSAASLDSNNGMNSNGNSMYNFNANPLFPPPGSQVPSSSSSSAQQQQGRPIVSDYDQQAADQFHAEAFELRKKGNFPGAIEEYSKALKFHPTHFKSLFNRGFAYDKVGQFDLAIQDYSAAIEIEPNYPLCYYNRGITYDHMNQSQRAFDDFSTAITLYEEKMQQQQGQQGQPDTSLITQSYIDFYQNRAFCGKKMSLLEQAIKDFSSVVSLTEQVLSSVQQPSLVNVMHNYLYKAYFHRSLCQERLSNYQEAIQDVSKAMQEIQILHSNNSSSSSPNQPLPLAAIGTMVNCLTTRANLWEVTQQDDLAFQDYSIALKHLLSSSSAVTSSGQMQPLIANQLFTVYTARGKLHAKQEIFDMAIEDYSSILNMIPRNAPPPNNGPGNGSNAALWWTIRDNLIETYQARGLCFKTLQDYSAALQDYQQIIRLAVNNNHNGPVVPIENTITIFQEIANCNKKLENYEAAIEAYSKLLDLSPKNIKAYNSRAFLFAKLGRFKEAVQDYSTVIHIDPTNSHAFHNRGISYDKMGLIDLAITDFGKVSVMPFLSELFF